ncbi:hypothetical protein SO802_013626 [Lithocarpus litseifolius]|uniref:HMA domain-containing protein n=1 Tax=Lithocarpus litseifolius TaxID=425828 RepID=A0AAW2D9T6_9ROSI
MILSNQICILKVEITCCDECPIKLKKKKLLKTEGVTSVNIDSTKGTITIIGDIIPTILMQVFEKIGKPAELLFFERSPPHKRKVVLMSRTTSNLHVMIMMMMMMSMYPKGAVLLVVQCMASNMVGVDVTAKLVVSPPLVVQGCLRHHGLHIDHSQGHSLIRYGMVFPGFLDNHHFRHQHMDVFYQRPPQKYNPITHYTSYWDNYHL